jgi:hypothetical protein
MKEGKPPIALLKTWLWMMLDEELRAQGEAKIVATFSNIKNAIEYLEDLEERV